MDLEALSPDRTKQTIGEIGFWCGLLASGFTGTFLIVQLLQLFRLIPYPLDQILIFGSSLGIALPLMVAMLALHHIAPIEKKFWSHAALLFTVMYVIFVTANYIVQLSTVIPMTLKGRVAEIVILQQTPHSLLWDFDAIGYLFMGLAALFAFPVFKKHGSEKPVRYVFLAHALVTPLIVFVYFYPDFSEHLLLLAAPWAITAPLFMLLLALNFKKDLTLKSL